MLTSWAQWPRLTAEGGAAWIERRPKRWGQVEPGLYRSGRAHRRTVRAMLVRYRIHAVIDLTALAPDNLDQRAELATARDLGIAHHRFPMRGDGTGDPGVVAAALACLQACLAARQTTWVHCAAGSQRTGTLIALHLLLGRGWPQPAVLAHLRAFGWRPRRDRALDYYVAAQLQAIRGLLEGAGGEPSVLTRP